MNNVEFQALNSENCMYHRGVLLVLLSVDNVVLISPDEVTTIEVKSHLGERLDMKDLGELQEFLQIRFTLDSDGIACLSQSQYTERILDLFHLKESKPMNTPAVIEGNDTANSEPTDENEYQELVDALFYLATHTRLDIFAAIKLLCCKSSCPQRKT